MEQIRELIKSIELLNRTLEIMNRDNDANLIQINCKLQELVNASIRRNEIIEGKINDLSYEISCLSEGTGTEWQ
jgi:hypothetical protein